MELAFLGGEVDCMGTLPCFSGIFTKGDIFSDEPSGHLVSK